MLSAATSASGGFSENSTVWKFTKSAAFLLPSLRTFTSLRSSYSHRWQGPSKVHGWGKWKKFFWVCIRPFRLRLEPLCVACAAFETTFLAAHWQLVCPGVTVWLFQVCPSPCGRRHKHACSHVEKNNMYSKHESGRGLFSWSAPISGKKTGRHFHPKRL